MALDTAAAADAPPPSSGPLAAGGESAEELDARYAPYARRDAYGVMGRGPLAPAEAVRLALAAAVLLPLRFVAGMLVLLLYYLVCRVCTLGVAADGDRPRLAGWRRKAVLRAGCALSRAMLFVFGFYWIRETHRTTTNAEDSILPLIVVGIVFNYYLHREASTLSYMNMAVNQDQSEELGRPGTIVSNHVSYVDILYHMSASFPSFVAKWLVHILCEKMRLTSFICISYTEYIETNSTLFFPGAVTERVKEVCQDKNTPMMLLFPEGTTTNGDYLLPFKTGAFLASAPVQPVILRYPYKRFSPAWDSMDGVSPDCKSTHF
ncbi:hypothetical protein HU200_021397 [Digitaria exilis]|uniref:Phospholipid/glycerol acyltransferase domain-containing protein n=1 Tax=Digitaria exilis TaxID=1010633 RepID=A0A835F0I5_9POAL|nr:hypothetical protein HU200_021397 [Digitaria exilis]